MNFLKNFPTSLKKLQREFIYGFYQKIFPATKMDLQLGFFKEPSPT